jgi:hypothetical protein
MLTCAGVISLNDNCAMYLCLLACLIVLNASTVQIPDKKSVVSMFSVIRRILSSISNDYCIALPYSCLSCACI